MKPKLSPTRLAWKLYYRHLRIVRRETAKQMEDMIIFGTGFLQIGPRVPDGIRHIPINEIQIVRQD